MLGVIVVQALLPTYRLLLVLSGAALALAASAVLGVSTPAAILRSVPWDVLIILVALGVYAQQLADSRLFGWLSVRLTRRVQARPLPLMLTFTLGTYLISGFVNNLTALLVVLPVLLSVFAIYGVTRRYATWTLGLLLVACNLGGAATPIGDFPAVLLLGRGVMSFGEYLSAAAPPTLLSLGLLLAWVTLAVAPTRDLTTTASNRRLTLAILQQLYRGVRLNWRLLAPALGALGFMLAGWMLFPASWSLSPDLVCWLGALMALAWHPTRAEAGLRRLDFEAPMFLLGFFLMVGAVRASGFFVQAAQAITHLPLSARGQVMAFLILAALLTGIFSAGPSMAALLEVAEVLARNQAPEPIYVGLALSVCAGSSLFLTAATSGPLTQSLVEKARLKDTRGEPVTFGFNDFLPVGLISFSFILAVNLTRTWWLMA